MIDYNLTPAQAYFLLTFWDFKGDLQATLAELNLKYADFAQWCRSLNFCEAYQNKQRLICDHLDEENNRLAKNRLNKVLRDNFIQEIQTVTIERNGKSETKTVTTKKSVSVSMIQLAIRKNTILEALQVLVSQGLISRDIAEKASTKTDSYIKQMRDIFGQAKQEQTVEDKERSIAILKQMFYGADDEYV